MDLNSVTQVSHLMAFGGSFEISIKKGHSQSNLFGREYDGVGDLLPSRHAIFTKMACYKMDKNSKSFLEKKNCFYSHFL